MSTHYGIRRHFVLLALFPLLVMAIGLESFFLNDRFNDLNRDLLMRGQLLARQLAASSEYGVFSNNYAFLIDLTNNTLRESDVRAVIVVQADSVMAVSGNTKLSLDKVTSLVDRNHPVVDDGKVIWLYQPILSAQILLDETEINSPPRQVGGVIIEMSWDSTSQLKSKLLWTTVVGTLVFLLITLYLVYLASRRIIDPISRLSEAVDAIGAGNLDTRVVESSCVSELCTLTDGINQMTAELQRDRGEMQNRIDEATEQLRHLAFFDSLTKLPNRRLLNDRLTQALAISKRSGCYGAVMFLDLDNFKPINDRFGHAVGDMLLIEAAHRIARCLRETDTVARFGGDEFVVMLGELDVDKELAIKQALSVAEKIREALATPYHLINQQDGKPVETIEHVCTSSIGVNLFLGYLANKEEILAGADSAMYQAKQGGRNAILFFECNPEI